MNRNPLTMSTRNVTLWVCVVAVFLQGLLLAMPSIRFFEHASSDWLVIHVLLEMFSVVVSVTVVLIAWHSFTPEVRKSACVLIFGFMVVAGMDLIHAVSYEGMPSLGTPGSTAKAIFFWFMGRGFELVTIWLVVAQVSISGSRWHWLLGALMTIATLFVFGTWHLDQFPVTFIPGQGVTPFKASVELFLCAGNLLCALYYYWRWRRHQDAAHQYFFAAACLVMGLGELNFTTYFDAGESSLFFGHIYKIVAYALIYAGAFMMGMREPYEKLRQSEQTLLDKQAQIDGMLAHVPASVSEVDRDGRYRYVNKHFSRRVGRPVEEILGQKFEDVLPQSMHAEVSYRFAMALTGQVAHYDHREYDATGQLSFNLAVSMAPLRNLEGQITGVIAVSVNTTEQYLMHHQLLLSLKETTELKKALDAHAIVAVTDVRGIILSVNEKFCEISGYSAHELIGQTHFMVKSDYHPESFYREMWRTIARGGIWSGEFCNRAKDGSLFWVNTTIVPALNDAGKPVRYIAIRTDITQRKRAELTVEQMAYQDALTGLPNRRLLMDRLTQQLAASVRSERFGALMFIDLDHFKEINDSLGHESGDALLHEAARRMGECVRASDTVARFGGDEFVVLMPDLGDNLLDATSLAGRRGENIRSVLNAPYALQGVEVICTPSIGITMYGVQDLGATELLKQADIALYQAKDEGRNTLCFFDIAIQRTFEQRMALETDLRKAMANGEFVVFYQPITDHQRTRIGVEALLRWRHPRNGLVSPWEFIPLAEKTGLIVPLGQWVIEQACQKLAQWETDPVRRAWSIAVNVSERQFRHPDFVEDVIRAIERARIRPGLLKLEVTEGSLQTHLHGTVEKMNQLRALGVRFSIDDFGTGYSSLSYLRQLPIHTLKIDRAFVMNIDSSDGDAVIARTIVALAEQLGLEVVAEGVETDRQFEILCDLGCRQFQGYLLGRPVPVEELTDECALPA